MADTGPIVRFASQAVPRSIEEPRPLSARRTRTTGPILSEQQVIDALRQAQQIDPGARTEEHFGSPPTIEAPAQAMRNDAATRPVAGLIHGPERKTNGAPVDGPTLQKAGQMMATALTVVAGFLYGTVYGGIEGGLKQAESQTAAIGEDIKKRRTARAEQAFQRQQAQVLQQPAPQPAPLTVPQQAQPMARQVVAEEFVKQFVDNSLRLQQHQTALAQGDARVAQQREVIAQREKRLEETQRLRRSQRPKDVNAIRRLDERMYWQREELTGLRAEYKRGADAQSASRAKFTTEWQARLLRLNETAQQYTRLPNTQPLTAREALAGEVIRQYVNNGARFQEYQAVHAERDARVAQQGELISHKEAGLTATAKLRASLGPNDVNAIRLDEQLRWQQVELTGLQIRHQVAVDEQMESRNEFAAEMQGRGERLTQTVEQFSQLRESPQPQYQQAPHAQHAGNPQQAPPQQYQPQRTPAPERSFERSLAATGARSIASGPWQGLCSVARGVISAGKLVVSTGAGVVAGAARGGVGHAGALARNRADLSVA